MKDSTKTITNDREISYKEIVIIGKLFFPIILVAKIYFFFFF